MKLKEILLVLLKLTSIYYITHAAKQPNIILLLMDDLGYHDVGFQGSDIKTPEIDRLANRGIILNRHYVLPLCSPSRAALLTGKYPTKTGIYCNVKSQSPFGLPLKFHLLPEVMQQLNYSTHFVGKWHLGYFKKEYFPTNRGFDTFFGTLLGTEYKRSHLRCGWFEEPCKNNNMRYGTKCCGYTLYNQTEISLSSSGVHSTKLYFKQAINRLHNHVSTFPEKPFFLILSPTAPHEPLDAPRKYSLRNSQRTIVEDRTYAGMVSHIDEWIGQLTKNLKYLNLWENTIIVFFSDNGGNGASSSNWPLRNNKGSYYEGGIRSVSFISSPLLQRKGRINSLMHVTDWFPIFAKLGGAVQTDPDLDGYDMWDVINNGNVTNPRKQIIHGFRLKEKKYAWLNESSTFPCDTYVRGSLQIRNWKLITGLKESADRRYALYDTFADEREEHDVSQDKPIKLKKMCHKLHTFYQQAVPPHYKPRDPNSNPALHGNQWIPWMDNV